MHRWITLFVASLIVTLLPGVAEATPRTQECRFILGFEALHALIPAIVGDCVADETHNPNTGDALQETTNGLLVWRRADNWTAFTDGQRTWIVGPFGLQSRLNGECFEWESDAGCVGTRLEPAALVGGDILTVSTPSNAGNWTDPATAAPEDLVTLRVVARNTSTSSAAANVVAVINLPPHLSAAPSPSVTISADNTAAVGDTAVIQVQGGSAQGLRYLVGQALVYSESCLDGCPIAETIVEGGVSFNLGTLEPGETMQLVLWSQVTNFTAMDFPRRHGEERTGTQ